MMKMDGEQTLWRQRRLLENQIFTFWEARGERCNTEIAEEAEDVSPGGIIDKVSSGEDGTK